MYSAAAKTTYAITQTDIDNQFASVPVLWAKGQTYSPDSYVIFWAVNDISGNPPGFNFIQGDMHNISETGFEAVVYLLQGFTPGETFVVHAVAFGLGR